MADMRKVEERLELSLGYEEFARSLKEMSNTWNSTVKRMSSIGGDISKNLSAINRQVTNNIASVGKATSDALKNTLSSSRDNLSVTHQETRRMLGDVKKDHNELNKLLRERGKILGQQLLIEKEWRKRLQKTGKDFEVSVGSDKVSIGRAVIKASQEASQQLLKEQDKQISLMEDNLQRKLSKFGVSATEAVAHSAKSTVDVIARTTMSASNSLSALFQKSKSLEENVERLVVGKGTLEKIKKQHQDLGRELTNINKLHIDAQKGLETTRLASDYFINKQIAINAEKAAEEKRKVEEEIRAEQKKTVDQTKALKAKEKEIIKEHDIKGAAGSNAFLQTKLAEHQKELESKLQEEIKHKAAETNAAIIKDIQERIKATKDGYGKDIAMAEENYQRALGHHEKITALQKSASERYAGLSTALSSANIRQSELLSSTSKGVSEAFDLTAKSGRANIEVLNAQYAKLAQEFLKSTNIGKQSWGEHKKLINEVGIALNTDITQMKSYIALMEKLKSVGVTAETVKIKGMQTAVSEIENFKKQFIDAVKTVAKLNFTGPLATADVKFKEFGGNANQIIRNVITNLRGISKVDLTSFTGIGKAIEHWKELQTSAKQSKTVISSVEGEITKLTKFNADLQVKIDTEANQKKAAAYAVYAQKVKKYISELEILKNKFVSKIPTQEIGGGFVAFPRLLARINTAISSGFLNSLTEAGKLTAGLENGFEKLLQSVTQFGTLGTGDIRQFFGAFNELGRELDLQLVQIRNYIQLLERLKSAGDTGAAAKIEEFRELASAIENFKKQFVSASKTVSSLNFAGPLKEADLRFNQLANTAADAFIKIKSYQKDWIGITSQKGAFESALGILKGAKVTSGMISELESVKTVRENIAKEIERFEGYYNQLTLKSVSETNKMKAASYASYANAVKMHIEALKTKQMELDAFTKKVGISDYTRRLKFSAESFAKSINTQIGEWANLNTIMEMLKSNYLQVERYSTRYTKAGRESAVAAKHALDEWGRSFHTQRQTLQIWIRDLERLSKAKLINAEDQIASLKTMLTAYNSYAHQVRSTMAGAAKFVDSQERQMEKGLTKRFMESFRNLRWQVATFVYMTGMALNAFKNYFISALEKVDEFRRGVYAITASIGLSMGKDFKNYYDDVYTYSSELAEKLQKKVGKTYASLEDMMMVTRSLAQGGIFVKTDEDVDRVSTLATAVKVMTEGMANAGVQMRQEIMALIEGRQRVTDSVAMAFRMQGIDIKKEMAEWAREGKSKLQGFSELLEPFARVNKEIGKEFGVQVAHLKNVWDYIQRIATTKLTLSIAKDLKSLAESLRTDAGPLTQLGESWTRGIAAGFKIVWEVCKSVFEVLKSIGNIIFSILDSVGVFATMLTPGVKGLSDWGQKLYGILRYIMAIEFAIVTLLSPIQMAAKWFQSIFYSVRALTKLLSFDTVGAANDWAEANRLVAESFKDYPQYVNNYNKRLQEMYKSVQDIDKSMQNIGKTQQANTNGLLSYFEVQGNILKFTAEMEKIEEKNLQKKQKANKQIEELTQQYTTVREAAVNQIKQIDEAIAIQSKEGIDKYKVMGGAIIDFVNNTQQSIIDMHTTTLEFVITENDVIAASQRDLEKENVSFFETISASLKAVIAGHVSEAIGLWSKYINYVFNSAQTVSNIVRKPIPIPEGGEGGGPKVGPTIKEANLAKLKEQKDTALKNIKDMDAQFNKTINAIRDKADAGGKTAIDMWDQYMGLMEKFATIDPLKKPTYEFWKNLAEIEKAAQENLIVQEHYFELVAAAQKKWVEDTREAFAKAKDIYDDFTRKMSGRELTEDQKLDESFKNMRNEIEKSADLTREMKDNLIAQLPAHEKIQRAMLHEKALLEAQLKYLDVYDKQAELLEKSTSYSDKRTAAAIRLQNDYQKWVAAERKDLKEISDKWGPDSTELALATKRFEDLNNIQRQITNESLTEIWEPFYKDLKDMQEGWADSISSTFTDILFDAKDWKTKVSDLFKDISKQIINAFVKRNIIEPMFDKTSDITKGGPLGKLFGMNTETGESTGVMSGVNKFLNIFGLGSQAKKEAGALQYTMMNPLPVVVTNMSGTGILGGITTGGAGGTESKGFFSGISNFFSDTWTGIKGLFGYQTGGFIPGFGGGDKIPLLAEKGEFVIRKEIVKKLGQNFFENINGGRLIKRGSGGPVDNYMQLLSGLGTQANLESGTPDIVNALAKSLENVADHISDTIKLAWNDPNAYLEAIATNVEENWFGSSEKIFDTVSSFGNFGIAGMFAGKGAKGFENMTQFSSLVTKQTMAEITDDLAFLKIDFLKSLDLFRKSYKMEEGYKLGDILEHDKLYEAYPELKDMVVFLKRELFDARGSYSHPAYDSLSGVLTSPENIKLNAAFEDQGIFSTLLHEIQHAISFREGFPEGGNLFTADTLKEMKAVWEKNLPYFRDLSKIGKYVNETGSTLDEALSVFSKTYGYLPSSEIVNELRHHIGFTNIGELNDALKKGLLGNKGIFSKKTLDFWTADAEQARYGLELLSGLEKTGKYSGITSNKSNLEVYYSLFGEFLSRDVQKRKWLLPENRLSNMPLYDEEFNLSDMLLIGQPGKEHGWLDISSKGLGSKWKESSGFASLGAAVGFGLWGIGSGEAEAGIGGNQIGVLDSVISNFTNLSNSATQMTSIFGQVNSSGDSLAGSMLDNADSLSSSIFSIIESLGSMGSGGGGGIGNIFSGIGSVFGFAEGGEIKEPIFGVGLKSNSAYTFGEKENEIVTPKSKIKPKGIKQDFTPQSNVYVTFHMNAIDSKTGTEFLIKHSNVLESVVSKAVKSNRSIRRDIKNS